MAIATPPIAALIPNALSAAPAAGSDAARLREGAQGVEAMFLRQLLAAADKVDFGGEDLLGSSAQDTFSELRNTEFARIASGTGTLGLATQIEAQLARHLNEGG